ncbi:MAG TPA: TIGR01777 family oxidoreductase, partial [Chitinophagaceae bacterium]|nr:TIGR01777 family oxidoreductase [Chitinophagaceae bacterium]
MATILIAGGTGLIGKALTKALLEKNYDVIVLTRNASKAGRLKVQGTSESNRLLHAEWNVEKQTMDIDAISNADYIVHLAGANLGEKRWTKKRKREIVSSRVDSGKLIVESLKNIPNQVKAVISASAIGWYGPDRENNPGFKETDASFTDFLGQTCKAWEESIKPVIQSGKRLVKLRTGIVLSKEGGALKEFIKPLKFGLATILGNGKQIISWIHIDDLVRIYIMAIENEKLSGVYNAVTPQSVTNKEFILKLARELRGKYFIPIY